MYFNKKRKIKNYLILHKKSNLTKILRNFM